MSMPRPDYRTISRHPSLTGPPIAYAKVAGTCPCGDEVEEGDPIWLGHRYIEQNPDGTRYVDLTASEWNCQGPKHADSMNV